MNHSTVISVKRASHEREYFIRIWLFIHCRENQFNCDHCDKTFSFKSDLKHHLLIYSGERLFGGDSSETRFSRKHHLIQHVLSHSREKLYVIRWPSLKKKKLGEFTSIYLLPRRILFSKTRMIGHFFYFFFIKKS